MENEAKEENKRKEITKERLNKDKTKEVIISVYVESPSPPSIKVHPKTGVVDCDIDAKKSKNKSRPQAAKTRGGYDRRAQLLAYARELRQNPDTKPPEWPKNNAKSKPKADVVSSLELKSGAKKMSVKKMSNPVRIELAKSRKRYYRLVPEVDMTCQPRSIVLRKKKKKKNINKKKANGNIDFGFVGKLSGIMRGFCRS